MPSAPARPALVGRPAALLAVILCVLAAAEAHGLTFDPSTVGAPLSGAPAELTLPAGAAPNAGIVVLHGCDGVGPHYRLWAAQLARWGYAALLVDSFRPRGFGEVCNRGSLVPPEVQARDAFDAADYLRGRADFHIGRVGVIGFSHGGWAVLKAVLAGVARRSDEPPFAAAVAYYPGCDPPGSALETDTLILIGGGDDWTPAVRCERWRELARVNGHALQMKVYPGAVHGFEGLNPPSIFAGHHVGRNPEAAADALVETQNFFAARLGPR
jgi:dienelactone hydrolase